MFMCMALYRAILCLSLSMIDIQGFYAPLALALIAHGPCCLRVTKAFFAICVWLLLALVCFVDCCVVQRRGYLGL